MSPVRRFILLVVTFLTAAPLSACAQPVEPVIHGDHITFPNGKVLEFVARQQFSGDPQEALRQGEPVSVSTEPILVRGWNRLLLVKTESFFEGQAKKLSMYGWDGTQKCEIQFLGDLHVLEHADRILIAQQSAHYLVEESLILNSDCTVLAHVRQPETVLGFGISKDEKLFWIIAHQMKEGKPVTHAAVFDLQGVEVATTDADVEGPWAFRFEGRLYTVNLPAPDYPG